MGRGVTIALCQAGLRVILIDCTGDLLDRARRRLSDDARTYAILSPATAITSEEIMALTELTTDYEQLARADLIVENVPEKWETKTPVYERLGQVCRPGTVIGVNTSAISITRLAALTSRPDEVVGAHFMNPAPLKPTVELIRGYHTSDATIALMQKFLSDIGKKSIVVKDSPGFVTNRVMMLTINEAIFLLQEGTASAADIDKLFVECFGHAMGPLETADLIGLDTVLMSIEVLYNAFRDSKYRPCPLLVRMVDAGLHGRKTGQGFFKYRVPT